MPTRIPLDILLAHDRWATRNILNACSKLSDEQFHHDGIADRAPVAKPQAAFRRNLPKMAQGYGPARPIKTDMPFDSLIANAGRLKILTSLAVEERQEFVHLRRSTSLTDGNLASHARRLASGGMIAIEKEFRDGKPVTHFTLTVDGRKALEAHTRRLIAAISHRRIGPAAPVETVRAVKESPLVLTVSSQADSERDDWVD